MRRIVNSVLTSLDNWAGEGMIVATTNDKDNLDSAVWRRFDERVDIDLPEKENRVRLWDKYTNSLLNREELRILSELSEGFSPAEIEIYSQQGLRIKVIKDKNPFLTILDQLSITISSTKLKTDVVQYLKTRYPDLSTREIGEITKISKSSVQRYVKEMK
jgi:SpoVK/Ycf46/Vps4 family AAA+-type ATPase